MENLELTVSSIEEAMSQASAKWGVDASELSATVLEEQPGLFGKKKLKVSVTRNAAEAPAAPKKGRGKAAKAEPVVEVEAEAAPEPAKAQKPAKEAKPRKGKATEKAAEAPAATEGDDENGTEQAVATQEDADRAADMLEEILRLATLEVEVKVRDFNGRYVNIELDGADTAHVVGKSGEVLNNLQYLMNIILTRKVGNGVRVTIDGNNYRERREEKLRELAIKVAEAVIERQEEAVLDALPAFERRVVHKVLAEIDGVKTYSEGEEPERQVVIAPA